MKRQEKIQESLSQIVDSLGSEKIDHHPWWELNLGQPQIYCKEELFLQFLLSSIFLIPTFSASKFPSASVWTENSRLLWRRSPSILVELREVRTVTPERLKFFVPKDHTEKTILQLQTQKETSITWRFKSTVRLIIRFLDSDSQGGVIELIKYSSKHKKRWQH